MEASALRAPAGLAGRRPGSVLLRLRSDEQLVTSFRQGNDDAFRVIHDRYRQRLSAYARQMLGGSSTDADDAMQDVFLRAYAALRADDRPVSVRAWLYRVAHNRCIDHLRRPSSQPMLELCEQVRPLRATTGDPSLAAERSEELRRLVSDVQALPDQQRSALLMREMEGLTYQELAGALDITMPAVKSLLVRARMSLVEAQQARDTPCDEIRQDITAAHDRGVRASGRTRRHMRECPGCRGYRTTLKGISGGLDALAPAPSPFAGLAKLLGIGAGGSGAAGGAAAAGGAVGAAGAAGATGTVAIGVSGAAATKLAAVVCCAAVFGGGAVEAARQQPASPRPATAVHTAARATAATTAGALLRAVAVVPGQIVAPAVKAEHRKAAVTVTVTAPAISAADPVTEITAPADPLPAGPPAPGTVVTPDGGVQAPEEDAVTPAMGNDAGSTPTVTTTDPSSGTTAGPADGTGSTNGTSTGATTTATGAAVTDPSRTPSGSGTDVTSVPAG